MVVMRTGASASAIATPSTTSMAFPEEEMRARGKTPVAFLVVASRPVWPACRAVIVQLPAYLSIAPSHAVVGGGPANAAPEGGNRPNVGGARTDQGLGLR